MKMGLWPEAPLTVSFFLSACASNGFMMAKPSVTLYGKTFPSKNMNADIEVYRTQRPDRPYVEIGQITCGDTDDGWNIRQIQEKAREIGADGVIIVGRSEAYGVGVPIGNMEIVTSEEYGITAIAIRYK
jgi:hypothetical protein